MPEHITLDANTIENYPNTLTRSGRVSRKPMRLGDLAEISLIVTLGNEEPEVPGTFKQDINSAHSHEWKKNMELEIA